MKKVFFIDDSEAYFNIILGELKEIGIECYPNNLEEFTSLRSEILRYFSCKKSIEQDSKKALLSKIKMFENSDSDVVYVVNYELGEEDIKGNNGIRICEELLKDENRKIILLSWASEEDDLYEISRFIQKNKNCYHISKNFNKFHKLVLGLISNF